MKKKVKALTALWLAAALVSTTLTMPASAAQLEETTLSSESLYVYKGSEPLSRGAEFAIGSNNSDEYSNYDGTTPLNQLDASYSDVNGWIVWMFDMVGGKINAFIDEWDADESYALVRSNLIFEPLRGDRDIHRITGQPTPNDPTVEVNYSDNATFMWYEVDGHNATPLDDETEATLKNRVAGKTYYCKVMWSAYSTYIIVNSDNVTFEAADSNDTDNGYGFNALFLLLLLKNSVRYYDGNTRVDTYKITKGETVEPLTLEDKDGMTLEGWYTDKELTEKFDFTQPLENGLALYSKWVAIDEATANEVVTETEAAE